MLCVHKGIRMHTTSPAPGYLIPALINEQRHERWRILLDVLSE